MNTTLFKIAVSAPGETPVVPDTGTISGVAGGVKSTIFISFAVAILVAAIFATIFLVQSRRKENFRPDIKKTSLGFLLVTILLTGILGPIGRTIDSGVDFSTSGAVTVKAELKEDESITVCGVDTITVKEDLLYGYNLWMSADDLVNDENENAKIVSMEEELVDGTWGYGADSPSELSSIPATSSKISEVTAEVATDSTKKVKYCAMLSPDTEPGVYSTTIQYEMFANAHDGGEGDDADYIMQEVGKWGDRLEIGDEVIAKDNRDGKEYYVAKLADGNIWMTQNLDHDIVDDEDFYTYENTDIGHGSIQNRNAKWTGVATQDELFVKNTTPSSYDPGDRYWDGNIASIESIDDLAQSGDEHYHIGNYYNWNAAVAMSDTAGITTEIDVDQSICPAGWMLPKITGEASISNLMEESNLIAQSQQADDINAQDAPTYLVFGSIIEGPDEPMYGLGRSIHYWTSFSNTQYNIISAYNYKGGMGGNQQPDGGTAGPTFRSDFIPIRCVARKDYDYIMQEVGEWADELEEGEQYRAKDNRDGKIYYVAKLADGNIWMTQNLDHDIVDTPDFYTYENTDIGHGSTPDITATWTASLATYGNIANWGHATSGSSYAPESYDPGDLYWNGEIVSADIYDNNGLTESSEQPHYHIGNYYNWGAAVALNSSHHPELFGTDIDQSICPAGWTLPRSTGDKSLANLLDQLPGVIAGGEYGSIQDSPIYLVFGGGIAQSQTTGWDVAAVGSWSMYWSSMVVAGTGGPGMAVSVNSEEEGIVSMEITPYPGFQVRCVAR